MSWYTKIVNMIALSQITDAQLTKLKDTGLDTMLSEGRFTEITIGGVVKTPAEQVEMLKTAITAILAV